MTNAEKFLKDGVSVEEFIESYLDFSFSRVWEKNENSFDNITKKFFEQQTKPTLTEDERVILKNIGEDCVSLMRVDGAIYFHTEGKGIFPKLFQFIKERRRI